MIARSAANAVRWQILLYSTSKAAGREIVPIPSGAAGSSTTNAR